MKPRLPERPSASRIERLNVCVGSADLTKAIPGFEYPDVDPNKGAKAEGNKIHEIIDSTAGLTPAQLRGLVAALAYLSDLRATRRFKELSEYKVTIDWLKTKPLSIIDRVLVVQDELHVIDWKTGKILVYAEDNEQLLYYIAAVAHLAPNAKEYHGHIVQPWAGGHIDHVVYTPEDVASFMVKVRKTEEKILAGDTSLHPSDNCTFCPANPHSRGDKGNMFCPPMMQLLYPQRLNEAAILSDDE